MLAVVGALIAWFAIVTLINLGLRQALPGYAAAERVLVFTPVMLVARLAMATIASLGAGAVARSVAPASRLAPWIAGFVMLVFFVPVHFRIWEIFPAWYHLLFLLSLPLGMALGARLHGGRTGRGEAGPA
jgi:hypothetical protein